jgi:carbon monoxide dehydrogenase subunit G
MNLGSSFTVPADPVTVFDNFLDASTMKACIPGCEELVRTDETHYSGRLVNTIAHVRFNAAFSAEIVELDSPRQVRAVLQGEDMKLGSSLKLNATLGVAPHPEGSEVTYSMEMALWGKLGRLGESIIRRRTAEVERQFVTAFSGACGAELPVVPEAVPAPEPAPAATAPAATATVTEVRPAPAAAPERVPALPAAPAGLLRRLVARVRALFGRAR